MSRRLLLLVLMITLSLPLTAAPAQAQEQVEPTTGPVTVEEVDQQDSPVGEIIPRPNSGAEPQGPGDRGGSYQYLVLGLMAAFAVVAVASVVRQSRRNLRERDEVATTR